jgi:tetratricopeptide (TPR) repeat protein
MPAADHPHGCVGHVAAFHYNPPFPASRTSTSHVNQDLASARTAFERALVFLRSGDAAMAERLARAALEDFPGDANFLTVLGYALHRQLRHQDAEPVLRAAIEADAEYAKAHEALGQTLLALQRPEEAIQALRQALFLQPTLESAQVSLCKALLAQGHEAQARQVFDAFRRSRPHAERLARAAQLHREGRLDAAEGVYREVLREDPGNVTVLRLLGMLAIEAAHHRDAAVLLRQAVRLAPDFRVAWIDLCRALTELHELDEAIEAAQRAVALDPDRGGAHIALANALARSSRTDEALAAYERARDLQPENAETCLGLGNLLKTVGRQQEAIDAYREGIRLRPGYAELYWSLANLKTFRFTTQEVSSMQAALDQGQPDDKEIVHLSFALGKASEDGGDFRQAFRYYARGNEVRRAQEYYDPVETDHIGERIRTTITAEFVRRHAGTGYDAIAPIFIIGLPRSGSTLIEQILASHSQVEATHELPEAGRLIRFIDRQRKGRRKYPEAVRDFDGRAWQEIGQRYDVETRRYRHGALRFIDKMPNNFALVGLLQLAMPQARFINARRDPRDTCLSCYRQLFARGQSFTYDLMELGEYYLEYARMIDHWRTVLPGSVLDVEYESVVADLEGETRRLLEFCGLDWEAGCLDFHTTQRAVRTASSEQVRRPIYADSVGYWRNYAPELETLSEVLAPVLK